ncbi:hypothetical protein RUM43_003496 [Polyplax serrata]|uniref:Uncharacterized protein n=1 Tax=Polyplax serrata TaxID=468196 RepID=A0AAN8RX17_POLSC
MSSVPQGAFASFKVKQNLKKIKFGNADEEVTNSGHFLSSEAKLHSGPAWEIIRLVQAKSQRKRKRPEEDDL